jgi:hypothetical protein
VVGCAVGYTVGCVVGAVVSVAISLADGQDVEVLEVSALDLGLHHPHHPSLVCHHHLHPQIYRSH